MGGLLTRVKQWLGINTDPLETVQQKGEQHSLRTHGDLDIHPECAECRAIALEACAAAGVTPQQYKESFVPGSPTYLDEPRPLSLRFVNALLSDEETRH